MRSLHRLFRAFVLSASVAGATAANAAPLTTEQLPAGLRDWVAWVHHDEPDPACALVDGGDAGDEGCAWPGALQIAAGADGARFSIPWTVYRRIAVSLPGDATVWPQDVQVDGRAAPVVPDDDGMPRLWLEPGRHAVSGAFAWDERPESLRLPGSIALVDLDVDGARVFPLQREGDELWLGAPDTEARAADSIDLQVFRLVTDGVPATLVTRLQLDISGAGREESLGRPLPPGWQPIALDAALPARLDPDGSLRVQARPGEYEITLTARATAPLATLARTDAGSETWPAQEVWSYQGDPRLRITVAEGASAIDPAQAGVPSAWSALPAFLVEGDASVTIVERSRGLSDQDKNTLTLQRRLWLDFDGEGWSAKDTLRGTMVRDWRLDLAAPYRLTRAEAAGEGLLVTGGRKTGETGVEVRERNVALEAGVRIDGDAPTLPITGWQQAFDGVEMNLQLPPGYRLYAALGVERAPEAWIERWQLLDVFLVAFTTMLAFWLLRWPLAVVVAAYLVLGFHEGGAPVYPILVLLALSLVVRALPDGRLAQVMGVVRWGWFVVVACFVLPFAYGQVRLALYPQLEREIESIGPYGGADPYANAAYAPVMAQAPAPMAPPPPPPPAEAQEKVSDSFAGAVQRTEQETSQPVFVTGSRVMNKMRQRYANNASIQAGGGEPNWSWRTYTLGWSERVVPTDTMHLVISPPWVTRPMRLVVLALLVAALALVARARLRDRAASPPASRAGGAATALVVGLAMSGATFAQDAPPDALLEQLRDRTSTAPECGEHCARIARARVTASGDTLRVALELHAQARVGVPLPFDEKLLALDALTLDGSSGAGVLRRNDGEAWIVVERGVHRAELVLRAADADKIALRFPLPPAEVVVTGDGWEGSGVRDRQLLTDTLELVRVRDAGAGTGASTAVQQFPPFVRVDRFIDLDLDWSVATTVQRIAPAEAGFSVTVPLIAGERVMSADYKVRDGKVTAAVQPGENAVSWQSQLARTDQLTLVAPALADHAEVWRVRVSPTWNLSYAGVPVVYPAAAGGEWIHEFHPLPGETLSLTVTRPDAVVGKTVAIDGVALTSSAGQSETKHRLELTLRSTQGGQHVVMIPADGELTSITLDGVALNVRPEKGRIGLPLHPGAQRAVIEWREPKDIGFATRTPEVHVGAPASNLDTVITLPANRWLIATSGPRVGPAVLYWGEIVAMLIVAWGLSRLRRTPLRFHDWLLLGFGFSTFSWPALVLFAGWLFLLDARGRWAGTPHKVAFVLGQIALALLSFVALVVLVGALWRGLLGEPDMHVVGNASSAQDLRWFHDQTDDALPRAAAFTLSMWWYKAAMLAWALWLAAALGRWLRWGWQCFGTGGYWRDLSDGRAPAPQRAEPATPVTPTPAVPPPDA